MESERTGTPGFNRKDSPPSRLAMALEIVCGVAYLAGITAAILIFITITSISVVGLSVAMSEGLVVDLVKYLATAIIFLFIGRTAGEALTSA